MWLERQDRRAWPWPRCVCAPGTRAVSTAIRLAGVSRGREPPGPALQECLHGCASGRPAVRRRGVSILASQRPTCFRNADSEMLVSARQGARRSGHACYVGFGLYCEATSQCVGRLQRADPPSQPLPHQKVAAAALPATLPAARVPLRASTRDQLHKGSRHRAQAPPRSRELHSCLP